VIQKVGRCGKSRHDRALQAALREPDTAVIVSGFGFHDDHLSRPLLSAVESNMLLRRCRGRWLSAQEADG
jgi:hypothetical protein